MSFMVDLNPTLRVGNTASYEIFQLLYMVLVIGKYADVFREDFSGGDEEILFTDLFQGSFNG